MEKKILYILSTAPWNNPTAWCDKLNWVKKHFGGDKASPFYKRIILTHHKNLCQGDYLIDDRPHKCDVDKFTGEVLHFGEEGKYKDWESVVEYLMGGRSSTLMRRKPERIRELVEAHPERKKKIERHC